MDITAAAALMGIPTFEIASIDDSPAGDVVVTTAGTAYIIVPADTPDGDGRTGLMYLSAPHVGYTGPFPIYTMPAEDTEESSDGERDGGVVAGKDELLARARDLGIDAKGNWGEKRLIEAIAAAEAAAAEAGAARHDELIALDIDELIALAAQLGIATDGLDETALVDAILEVEAQ